ncbi:MAG TPA: hypothetical protein VNA11_19305 [Pseudonocardia sp.]|nr:hypothetical protein [Pseudonocardia sp.]
MAAHPHRRPLIARQPDHSKDNTSLASRGQQAMTSTDLPIRTGRPVDDQAVLEPKMQLVPMNYHEKMRLSAAASIDTPGDRVHAAEVHIWSPATRPSALPSGGRVSSRLASI